MLLASFAVPTICPPYAHQKRDEVLGQLHVKRLDATRIGGERIRSPAVRRMPCKRKEGTNMITNIDELAQNEAVAYLKADLCLSDPDNYSLDEKREICEEMAATREAIEEAMRKDFSELPPEGQDAMLNLLQKADPEHFDWWKSLLLGQMPDSVDDLTSKPR